MDIFNLITAFNDGSDPNIASHRTIEGAKRAAAEIISSHVKIMLPYYQEQLEQVSQYKTDQDYFTNHFGGKLKSFREVSQLIAQEKIDEAIEQFGEAEEDFYLNIRRDELED